MSGKGFVEPPEAQLVYLYDGSWPGFFSCVYESVYAKERPLGIWCEAEAQPSLYPTKWIETEGDKAARAEGSVEKKLGARATELLQSVFLTCLPEKELAMLRFLFLGYREGSKTPWMFGHPLVQPLLKAEQHMMGETHLLKGFVRFSQRAGRLVATIEPKNFVLPFLAEHFVERFSHEEFLIFDKTHGAALVYEKGRQALVPLESLELLPAAAEEAQWEALWKRFYNTISIEARENPRCRMGHMPKRYWQHMLEVKDLL